MTYILIKNNANNFLFWLFTKRTDCCEKDFEHIQRIWIYFEYTRLICFFKVQEWLRWWYRWRSHRRVTSTRW